MTKATLLKFLPLFIILIFVLLFFYPVWLKGLVPLPADIIVGSYYPWLDKMWPGYSTGVSVKNPITSDVISFAYPMRMIAVDFLKAGVTPLWNSLILSGTPLLANFQSAPFSITNLVYLLLPKIYGWTLQVILQPFLAATFLYFLLKHFKLSNLSSITGGLIFAFSGFSVIWMQWNAHSLVAAFFPLIFLFVLKWIDTEKIIYGVLISISLALQIFAGYPQIIVYEFIALILLILIFKKELFLKAADFTALLFFIGCGIGLAAIQILPAQELLTYSQRSIETIPDQWTFLPWPLLITFFAPDFFGNHATYNWWGPGNYTLIVGYSGIIATTLAVLGSMTPHLKPVRFAIGLCVISLLLALPTPISTAFKSSNLLGLQAGTAHRALILFNLGIAILCAFGLQGLAEGKFTSKKVTLSYFFPAVFLASFWLFVTFLWRKFGLSENYLSKMTIAEHNLILPSILLFASFLIILMSLLAKQKARYFILLLVAIAILELFRFGWKFTPFSSPAWVYPQSSITSFLQRQQKPFRVFAANVIPTNFMMMYNLETVEGYDAVYPVQYAKYLAVLNSGQSQATPQDRYGAVTNIGSRLLNLTNTRFVLALKKNENGDVSAKGLISKNMKKQNLNEVYQDGPVVILEKTDAWPRAKMFFDWDIESDSNQVLEKLIKDYPIDKKVILEKDPKIELKPGMANIDLSEYQNQGKIKVDTSGAGLLFIASSWYPGWVSLVDGQIEYPIRADYNFMVVPIRSLGEHIVEIKYQPSSFETGKMISLMSILALFIATACYFLVGKTKRLME